MKTSTSLNYVARNMKDGFNDYSETPIDFQSLDAPNLIPLGSMYMHQPLSKSLQPFPFQSSVLRDHMGAAA